MTFRRRTRTLAAATLTAALALAATGYAGSAAAAPVPAPRTAAADAATPRTIAVEGPQAPASGQETLHGTLRVDVTEPVIGKGTPLSSDPPKTTYSVITSAGERVPIAGDIPATAKNGAIFDGTVSVRARPASPSTARAVAPLAVATATITPSPMPTAHNHTVDLVTIDPAGATPLDTSTYTDNALWSLSYDVDQYWTVQSQKNNNTDQTKQVFFSTPTTVTHLQSTLPCSQDVDTLWDQAATALGYTSAQNYLDTPPAPDYGHQLVVLLPPGCENDWTGIGTIGDGVGSSGLIEVTLGLGVDKKLLAHEIGTNLGIGSSDLAFCGRTTAGPTCTTYPYGDLYDIMGAATTDDDILMNLNARSRTLLGWYVPGDATTYALAPGETSHTWTVYVNEYGSGAAPEIIQLTDPGTQQTYYVEGRFNYDTWGTGVAFYENRPVYAMDDAGKDLVSMPWGYRLITGTPGNGSLMITQPDSNYSYNDATALRGHTDGNGVTDQNASTQNPTGTITVADAPGGVQITLKAPRPRLHDYSGDGHPDVLARNSAGALLSYRGNGTGGWINPIVAQVGSGWNGMTAMAAPGDFNGDGHPDVLARDSSGRLWLYPGNGTGGWITPRVVGTGWNVMTKIVGVGDFTGDGFADIVATDTSGRLLLYPGNGSGGWRSASVIGTGWGVMAAIVGIGDFNGDGQADVVAQDSSGLLWLYPHTASGWRPRIQVGSGWAGMSQLHSVGDFDGNGTDDLVARDPAGTLWLYRGTGNASFAGRVQIGSGWGSMTWLG